MKPIFIRLKQLIALCLLITASIQNARADRFTEMAQHHWEWLQAARADSILNHATDEVRAQLSPAMLQPLWTQLVIQCGELKKQEEWQLHEIQAMHVCQKLLIFEHTALRLNVVLNDKMELAGISFTPAPTPEATPSTNQAALPTDFVERDFCVEHGKVSLPGTLTLPNSPNTKIPLVVMVQGSGPSDRDETMGPNKPFRDWAHALAQKGIATLRYDKRTKVYPYNFLEVSNHQMNYDTEVVNDAIQAIKQATDLAEIDSTRIFVLGHSLGGCLVPRIAQKSEVKLAGTIGVAAAARPFWQMVKEQLLYIAGTQGLDKAKAEELADQQMQAMKKQVPADYQAFQATYDPLKTARDLGHLPMLFVQGGHDYQVTHTDFDLWKQALKNNSSARFEFFEKNDHLMRVLPQMAVPADYTRMAEMDAEFIDTIADFIYEMR